VVRRRRQLPWLQGEASVAGFQRMFEGRHPNTGELLGRADGKGAVPAFDVVLRPTKSVSVLFGLGDPVTGRTVLAAHHAGVREAVAYLDEHLGARRGHGGVQHVSGQGLLAVGLDHRTSREGDPLLHTHLVVANRVQGPDGRWTALDGRDLYRHRLAAAAIYRAIYQRELSRSLGVEWTAADAHGNRELAGMPEALVRSYSKRSGQIDVELDRLAADGRERTLRLVKWAVQATRKPKQHEAPDTLYGRWRREAAERGQDSDTLVRTVTGRTANRGQDRTVSTEVASRLFDRLAGHRRHRRAPRRSHPGRARGVGRPVLCREDRGRGGGSGTGGAPLVHPRTAGRGAAAGRRRHRPGRRADRRCWP
jgi:conjugative relaxase-like TrwC/TraI family protein